MHNNNNNRNEEMHFLVTTTHISQEIWVWYVRDRATKHLLESSYSGVEKEIGTMDDGDKQPLTGKVISYAQCDTWGL